MKRDAWLLPLMLLLGWLVGANPRVLDVPAGFESAVIESAVIQDSADNPRGNPADFPASQPSATQFVAAASRDVQPQPSSYAPQSRFPDDGKLRIIVFGAHPDDAEFKAGGTAALWAALGHHVKFVSVTNGNLGHYEMSGGPLAQRRTAEVQRAAEILDIADTVVLDIHDGELMPTLENRKTLARLIRDWQADIVLSHRPNDYNPDHRYVGVLVQDTAFMVTVPFFCPDTPPCKQNPVYLYLSDRFQKPTPFQADVVVAIDDVFQQKIDAVDALESQVYETVYGVDDATRREILGRIPQDRTGRRDYAEQVHGARYAAVADAYREALIRWYGDEKGRAVRYAEAFEICEYGRQPSEQELRTLFPFFGEQ